MTPAAAWRRLQRLHERRGIYLRKIDASGRVYLPAALLREWGWGPGTELLLEMEGDVFRLTERRELILEDAEE